MRRRILVSAACLVASAGGAAAAAETPSAQQRPEPGCGFSDAQRLARNGEALLVRREYGGDHVWGCAAGGQVRRTRLKVGACPDDVFTVCGLETMTLKGPVVGYSATRNERGAESATATTLRSIDLRTGVTIHRVGSLVRHPSRTRVGGLVYDSAFAATGALAWINQAPARPGVAPFLEVRRLDAEGFAVVSASPTIDPRSLRIRGTQLQWKDGTERRTAPIS